MKYIIAMLWTTSLILNSVSCAAGNEPSWFISLTTLFVLTFNAWIDTL